MKKHSSYGKNRIVSTQRTQLQRMLYILVVLNKTYTATLSAAFKPSTTESTTARMVRIASPQITKLHWLPSLKSKSFVLGSVKRMQLPSLSRSSTSSLNLLLVVAMVPSDVRESISSNIPAGMIIIRWNTRVPWLLFTTGSAMVEDREPPPHLQELKWRYIANIKE